MAEYAPTDMNAEAHTARTEHIVKTANTARTMRIAHMTGKDRLTEQECRTAEADITAWAVAEAAAELVQICNIKP